MSEGPLPREGATFEATADVALAIGIDLGGTRLRMALADFSGAIIDEADEPADRHGGTALIERIGTVAASMVAKRRARPRRLLGAALAV
ncbi:hypothetical protein, partial [Allosphingosinicella sp.]|uniref:hypothetical protein n=1 Tax=Allosphingosinicella sp. TaxID=2823234 RepID=UPI002F1EFD92